LVVTVPDMTRFRPALRVTLPPAVAMPFGDCRSWAALTATSPRLVETPAPDPGKGPTPTLSVREPAACTATRPASAELTTSRVPIRLSAGSVTSPVAELWTD